MRARITLLTAAAAGLLAVMVGCADPAATAPSAPGTAAVAPAAADSGPSKQAQMVCEPEAQGDIELVVGVSATKVGPLAYADHTSTCRYTYADGAFTLTVQDLSNQAASLSAYDALGQKLGRTERIVLPDADAAATSGGSVILHKDNQVLLVDVSTLPEPFGRPPVTRSDAARLIAKAVLSCWTG